MKKNYFFIALIFIVSSLQGQVQNRWVWIQGTDIANDVGTEFGLVGLEDEQNWPDRRYGFSGHVDTNGKFWLFGGIQLFGAISELWVFDPTTNNFTYKKGRMTDENSGYSNGLGIEHFRNDPAGRFLHQSWIDGDNNIWVFSGQINTENGAGSNDMWKYNKLTGNWLQVRESTEGALGVFGTKGIASQDNIPPGLYGATTWEDNEGNLWMYGGCRWNADSNLSANYYNTLWKFDITSMQWTWMWGDDDVNSLGSYVEKEEESDENYPGSRSGAEGWIDSEGNLWLYGGRGPQQLSGNEVIGLSDRNDIWKYNTVTGLWTWMKGSATNNAEVIETVGSEAVNNTPKGTSEKVVSWRKDNEFWIYGTYLANLWKFNMLTNNWTLVRQQDTTSPVYGELGVPDIDNSPGLRSASVGWLGNDGNLYFYCGKSSNEEQDVWKFDIAANSWVWIKGCGNSLVCPQKTKLEGIMNPEVSPGANTSDAPHWEDLEGNLWVLGGDVSAYDPGMSYQPEINTSMWKFDVAANQWQWKNGIIPYDINAVDPGPNGPFINPGCKVNAMKWVDAGNDLWLYGGSDINGEYGNLWKFDTQENTWELKKGSGGITTNPDYGNLGISSDSNQPTARYGGVSWTDNDNVFWMFGGSSGALQKFNDLWKFDPSTEQWTWMKGGEGEDSGETNNGIGMSDAANTPPYSEFLSAWKDSNNNLWLYVGQDIWKFDIDINSWIKMLEGGEINYGLIGIEAPTNFPGQRIHSATWTDSNGDLLLYGGEYLDSQYNLVYGSDLWRYSISSGMWTWIGGSNEPGANPIFGEKGQLHITNFPGTKIKAIGWTDNDGNRMLYGGANSYDGPFYSSIWKLSSKYNIISGTIRLDNDADGCETGDTAAENIKIAISGATNSGFAFTDAQGNYSLVTDSEDVTIIPEPGVFSVFPVSQTFTFDGFQNNEVADFCLTAPAAANDLQITVLPLDAARPGFDARYQLVYVNKGTAPVSGTIQFSYDEGILDFESSDIIPVQQSEGFSEWEYSDLQPFESRDLTVILNINNEIETPAVNIGDFLALNASILPVAADVSSYDNEFELAQPVVSSDDLNDKACLQGNVIAESMVGEFITYLIRFENTGNAEAANIIVKDVIDTAKFDISSIEPMYSSHDYKLEVTQDNIASFIFNAINLPYGNDNPLRYGFVAFRVKTIQSLEWGDVFENEAKIYFDYNQPVATNVAQTYVGEITNGVPDFEQALLFYPNPVKDKLFIGGQVFERVTLYDIQGRIVQNGYMSDNLVNMEGLSAGIYFVKLTNGRKSATIKVLKE